MSGMAGVQIVALIGWLALMISVYASYRLNWQQTLRLVLIWACIFAGMTFLVSLLGA